MAGALTVLLSAATVVTGTRVLRPGWLELTGDRVSAVGAGEPPGAPDIAVAHTVVPGFVDVHLHGGGGFDFSDAPAGEVSRTVDAALAVHRRRGTTTAMASLVSATAAEMHSCIKGLAPLVGSGVLAGIHLEGPWLAPARRGAHRAEVLRDPDPTELDRFLAAGDGTIRMVTLAPELPGALDAVRRLVDAGVTVAIGHTDADYDQTRAAIDAGATMATHLFNAMRPVDHRRPGPVVALLEDPRVTVEVIADGVHVDPAVYRWVLRTAGTARVALVSDAMAAAGMGDGDYRLGGLAVTVAGGTARVAGTSTIAGGTASADALFRFALTHAGADGDAALLAAAAQTSVNPARALGIPGGSLEPGAPADAVLLDDRWQVAGVLLGGRLRRGPDVGPVGASGPPQPR